MSVRGMARRGGVRCLVARDFADELERVAELRERDAGDSSHQAHPDDRRALAIEAAALRSVVLTVRRINLQE